MKRILLVFGTRPEAIKMAPLVKEFQKYPELFETIVCVTAQHREMLDQVLHLFEIVPDYDLDIMKPGQDLYDITSRVLLGMKTVLKEVNPDVVLVHGDTSTSTASALAAFYQQISVGHVEAGLRTNNIYSPWPEEMNRQITGRLSTYHFAPTNTSKQNLLDEGINESSIHVTGNTVIDSLHWVVQKIEKSADIQLDINSKLNEIGLSNDLYHNWSKQKRKLILITGHRRENFGKGFKNICESIKELALRFPDSDFVYPMHLNPNVRDSILNVFGGFDLHKNIFFIEPLEYVQFIYLMKASYIVLTDSGGIQEEAPGLGIPVLVMRDTTERPEALEAGTVRLVGTNKTTIINVVTSLLTEPEIYEAMTEANNPYGDGHACNRIVNTFLD